jgi:hypothetical protein
MDPLFSVITFVLDAFSWSAFVVYTDPIINISSVWTFVFVSACLTCTSVQKDFIVLAKIRSTGTIRLEPCILSAVSAAAILLWSCKALTSGSVALLLGTISEFVIIALAAFTLFVNDLSGSTCIRSANVVRLSSLPRRALLASTVDENF